MECLHLSLVFKSNPQEIELLCNIFFRSCKKTKQNKHNKITVHFRRESVTLNTDNKLKNFLQSDGLTEVVFQLQWIFFSSKGKERANVTTHDLLDFSDFTVVKNMFGNMTYSSISVDTKMLP